MRFLLFSWLLLLSFLSIIFFVYGQCLDHQKSSLLQLKQNFNFSRSVASATSRLATWNSTTDCCKWKGITCDKAGHVTRLDLNSELIYGGVHNWSSLFELRYLQRLNLAYNNFNSTTIPSGFDRLSSTLTYLNLSNSGFGGQIPIDISRLTRLVSLDLSTQFPGPTPLKLDDPDLRTLVRDLSELRELRLDGINISAQRSEWCQVLSSALTNLQVLSLSNCYLSGPFHSSLLELKYLSVLRLDQNNISAEVPDFFVNFSSLTCLRLTSCGLYGKFPENIFNLPTLQTLHISSNQHLDGSLPEEFTRNGALQTLVLSDTNLSGKLPDSIGHLRFLSRLDVARCGFNGSIPPSIANLSQLLYLDLSSNCFTGPIPSFGLSENLTQINLAHNRLTGPLPSAHWDRLSKLVNLNLWNNSLNGTIPSALFTLPSLQKLELAHNQFTGQLGVFSNGSSSMLDTLDLSSNKLEGPIPMSIFAVPMLKILVLSSNNFNGTVSLGRFQNLMNLSNLDLSDNSLTVINTNSTLFPQVGTLKLRSCQLKAFPDFLRNQKNLIYLDLSNNQITGKIPNWIWQIGNWSLFQLNLSHNFLEDLQRPLPNLNSSQIAILDLHSNQLQGPIPILPPLASVLDFSDNNFTSVIPLTISSYLSVTIFFSFSGNKLSGEIPTLICNASNLQVLDLSNNTLSSVIPSCLGGMTTLRILNLRGNNFHGTMPEMSPDKNCGLRTLDLNGNRLEGNVSRTLANCTMLEVLDLGNNQIDDTFPFWLGSLSNLRVLVLRSNRFYGTIVDHKTNNTFPMLQIVDLSSNNFTGKLPSECFLKWKGMMVEEDKEQSKHKHQTLLRYGFLELTSLYYQDAVTVTIKGLEMELVKILTVYTSIDFSNNRFEGVIPEVIGNLTSLYVLNLSRNALTGQIPSSLGNLKQLESLDLSNNNLDGQIPVQLTDLTFLSVLNVSNNQLKGMIPVGTQIQSFSEASFNGNPGLCGAPLPKCSETKAEVPPPSPRSPSDIEFDWQSIFTGLGFGGGAGIVVGPLLFWTKGRKWYDEYINGVLLMILPSTGLFYTNCADRRVDAEEITEEELTEMTGDYDDEEEDEEGGDGQFCVFCSKLDITRKRAVHNSSCTCHGLPLSTASSL